MTLPLLPNTMDTGKYMLSEIGHLYPLWKAKDLELILGEIHVPQYFMAKK
jgi:hypothetical protein